MSKSTKQLPFLSASAIGSDVQELVNLCLRDVGDLDSRFNFGFIYLSDALFNQLPRLQQLLTQATGITNWCGTLATAICCDNQEYYDQPAVSIIFCAFDEQDFSLIHIDPDHNKLLSPGRDFEAISGVIHADPTNPKTPDLITSCNQFGPQLNLNGAFTHSQTKQLQILGETQAKGVSGVVFNNQISILNDYTQGCSPIGEIHTISESENNFILKLDGKTALDILRTDVGEVLARDLTRLGGYVFAGLIRMNTITRDYLVRDLVAIDENKGALVISDSIETGDQIVFCRRDGNTASDDLDNMLARIKTRLNDRIPRGALYHSCIERGRFLFGDDSREIRRVQEALGNVPLAGFFASGEIYQNQLYTHTGVLTVFL